MDILISIIRLPIGLGYTFLVMLFLCLETFFVWVIVVPFASLGQNRNEVKQMDEVKKYPQSLSQIPKVFGWVFGNEPPPWK